MDRLSTVILGAAALAVVLAAAACDKTDKSAVAPAPRTNVAKTNVAQAATTEAFCDHHVTDDRGAAFKWPELAAGHAAPPASKTWRWVNLWATWCKPCIEEMPRLIAWREKLAAAGTQVELAFVSVDDSDAEVDEFRKAHPGTPPSVRIADADKRAEWLKSMGLDDGAIPIQLFVSAGNRLRCARAGGIRDQDYDLVAKLLAE
jgi:thiol-disulfide isomerase/thioredoxin